MKNEERNRSKKCNNEHEVEGERYLIAVGGRQREQVPRLCLFRPRCRGARSDRMECEMQS